MQLQIVDVLQPFLYLLDNMESFQLGALCLVLIGTQRPVRDQPQTEGSILSSSLMFKAIDEVSF